MIKKLSVFVSLFLLSVVFADLTSFAAAKREEKSLVPVSAPRSSGDGGDTSSYVIGTQNLLQIKIFGEADVNQMYRVDEDGFIKHSLAGRVKLGGLNVSEAEKLMEQKLDGDYIINPQINIFVLEYSHFSILGEVRKPGNYEITGRISVIHAISLAGGFTPIANQRGVQIIRKGASRSAESRLTFDAMRAMDGSDSTELYLQAEDVVVVPKSFF